MSSVDIAHTYSSIRRQIGSRIQASEVILLTTSLPSGVDRQRLWKLTRQIWRSQRRTELSEVHARLDKCRPPASQTRCYCCCNELMNACMTASSSSSAAAAAAAASVALDCTWRHASFDKSNLNQSTLHRLLRNDRNFAVSISQVNCAWFADCFT